MLCFWTWPKGHGGPREGVGKSENLSCLGDPPGTEGGIQTIQLASVAAHAHDLGLLNHGAGRKNVGVVLVSRVHVSDW